jgi:T5SS/PEP-CTERM-associated repeat protein
VLIENGAFLECVSAFIAEDSGGPVTLTATGFDSGFFVLTELNLGSGEVIISNGAFMGSGDAFIGVEVGGGGVTTTGPDVFWLNAGQLVVAANGNGSLDVAGAAAVYTGDAIVGLFPGTNGTVDVSGAGSVLNSFGDINVARFGAGTMNISLGAVVTSSNGFVGGFAGSSGNVTIDGAASSWDNLGFVTIGGNAGTGAVVVTNGATISAWQINVGANGSLVIAPGATGSTGQIVVAEGGEVSGGGTLVGDVFNAGTIGPGASIDTLTVEGDYVGEITGALTMEIAESGSDLLAVTGDVTLGGTLDVTLLDGFVPELCDRFTILTGASITGRFDTVNLPPGLAAFHGPTSIVLLAVEPGYAGPESFNVRFGSLSGGELIDLACGDDQRLIVDQRASISVLFPLIRIDVNGTSPVSTPTALTATLEAHANSLPGLPPQRFSLMNYDTGRFEVVDDRPATRQDSIVEVTITTDPQRFVQTGTDAMQMRVEYFSPGNVFSPAWGGRIDQAVWHVTP